jgi:hypothetical protein
MGRDMAGVRREGWAATCGVYAGARLVGRRGAGTAALRPVEAAHVAPRKRAGTAVPQRMDRRAEAGLGVRPSGVAARVARDTGATACALDAKAKPFRLTPFDRVFLQLFQLKWAE